jgi:LuxR family maltose regulon positive regulatory protein
MSPPILATKLYVPPLRPGAVLRPHLVERLNEGRVGKLTLISAPAGFGKTTLVSEWIAGCGRPVAWLSLDEGDNSPIRWLTALVAALQTAAPDLLYGAQAALASPRRHRSSLFSPSCSTSSRLPRSALSSCSTITTRWTRRRLTRPWPS